MQTAPSGRAETDNTSAAGQTLRGVFRNAAKAFEFIHKYRTPPDPKTYSVWYSYAAGTDSELVDRVDGLLSAKGSLAPEEIDAICDELLVPNTSETARQNIGQAMEKEIDGILRIVQKSVQNSNNFHASLNAVGSRLPNAISGEDLTAVISHLMAENRRMAATTLELSEGLKESQKQIVALNTELEEIQNQYKRDPLTSIANRRAFDERLAEQIELASRGGQEFCLAMADIDHFKKINDTHGHQAGDMVLKAFAYLVSQNIKGQDMVARIGGEEFAIILPQTDLIAAYNLLVKIKHSLKNASVSVGENGEKLSGVTASFGIARYEAGMTGKELVKQADSYLYDAKNSGRDRVKAKGL